MIKIHSTNFDDIEEVISKWAEDHEPKVMVENDGIGSYEFWGAKGYDKGTDNVIIDGDFSAVFAVDYTDAPEDTAEFLIDELSGHIFYRITGETRKGVEYGFFLQTTKTETALIDGRAILKIYVDWE